MKRQATTLLIKNPEYNKKPKQMVVFKPKPSLANPTTSNVRKLEKKNIDVTSSATIVFNTSTAFGLLLNNCVEGSAPTNHIGRAIQMKSIQWRWQGTLAPTTTGAASLRMLIVYDKQSNGAFPATNQIVAADNLISPMNLANSKRFIILADQDIPYVGTAGPQAWDVKGYRKINLTTEFNETNGNTIADIQTGAVLALFWQSGQLLVASPTNNFYSRIRFEDA